MRPIPCGICGHVFEGEKGDQCPRCAKIDSLMVDQRDAPSPPVVIPGPASSLANTLTETKQPVTSLERFAKDLDEATMMCPRCAERIRVKAKMCRFCQLDLVQPGFHTVVKRGSSGRHVSVERDFDDRPRVVHHHHHASSGISPGAAGACSFFFPGLGEICAGYPAHGISVILANVVNFVVMEVRLQGSWTSSDVVLQWALVAVAIWIFSICDAVGLARSGPDGLRGDGVIRRVKRRFRRER